MTEEQFVGPERYDDLWRNLLEGPRREHAKEWLKMLKGQVVVDLGSGGYTSQFEKLLHSLGVLEYIPVEKNKGQDMLEVLRALKPAGTYSFTMNGINQDLIPAESDYGRAVGEQINRLYCTHWEWFLALATAVCLELWPKIQEWIVCLYQSKAYLVIRIMVITFPERITKQGILNKLSILFDFLKTA